MLILGAIEWVKFENEKTGGSVFSWKIGTIKYRKGESQIDE